MNSVQLRHELALFFIIPFPCVAPPHVSNGECCIRLVCLYRKLRPNPYLRENP